MDRILLSGLEFFGRHGCHEAEKQLGQRFIIDITLGCDLRRAGQTDALDDTVDYIAVYNAARDIIGGPSVQLLEVLAQRIADFALRDPLVSEATVRIRKPHVAVPQALDFLGVEITRTRAESLESAG
jgi:dihydroneopterin aldolase